MKNERCHRRREATKHGKIMVKDRTVEPGFESQLCPLLTEWLWMRSFSFVAPFPHLQSGVCNLSYFIGLLWGRAELPSSRFAEERTVTVTVTCCDLFNVISSPCLRWLLNIKVTPLLCDILPLFLHQDWLHPHKDLQLLWRPQKWLCPLQRRPRG